jgi:hypothetical protein
MQGRRQHLKGHHILNQDQLQYLQEQVRLETEQRLRCLDRLHNQD